MKIIKARDNMLSARDIINAIGTQAGTKFGIKYKRGCRWKLKSFRLHAAEQRHCEYCGSHEQVSFGNQANDVHLDSHFGMHATNCTNLK